MRAILTFSVIIFSSLAIVQIAPAATPTANKIYFLKFKAKTKQDRSKIADLGVSIESIIEDTVIATGSAADLKLAKKSGMLEVYFEERQTALDFPSEDSNFHNYQELTDALNDLGKQHSDIVKISSIGKSVEGRDQWLVTISTDENDLSRPAVFFMGGHHAREHISVEMPLQLAQYLAREYKDGNPRVKSLLNTRTVYIVPVVNPDGVEYDVASGNYQMWRKNRHNNGGSIGVDLNRNYGYGWGGGGASKNPSSETYRGTGPFSEPETQNIKNFFESHKNITIDLSFHTFSELILYPWGHTNDRLTDDRDYRVHRNMAETMAKWNGYVPQQSSDLYIASGDTTDWAYGEHKIISFTFELDPASSMWPNSGFYPGQSYIEPVFKKNLEPCLYLIEYSDNPYRVIEPKHLSYGLNTPILQ